MRKGAEGKGQRERTRIPKGLPFGVGLGWRNAQRNRKPRFWGAAGGQGGEVLNRGRRALLDGGFLMLDAKNEIRRFLRLCRCLDNQFFVVL